MPRKLRLFLPRATYHVHCRVAGSHLRLSALSAVTPCVALRCLCSSKWVGGTFKRNLAVVAVGYMGDETGDPRGRSPFDREGLLMCLAIPMVLIERDEFQGVAEIDGVRREISVMYVPEAEVGDYVLVHAGFAIGQVDANEAAKTLELLREYSDSMVEL